MFSAINHAYARARLVLIVATICALLYQSICHFMIKTPNWQGLEKMHLTCSIDNIRGSILSMLVGLTLIFRKQLAVDD